VLLSSKADPANKEDYEAANRILKNVAKLEIPTRGELIRITCSIGMAKYTDRHVSLLDLFKDADQSLYDAKRKGRNRLEIANT